MVLHKEPLVSDLSIMRRFISPDVLKASWSRHTGTSDQKVETYFMHAWLYPLYKPFYSVIVSLSKIKRLILRS